MPIIIINVNYKMTSIFAILKLAYLEENIFICKNKNIIQGFTVQLKSFIDIVHYIKTNMWQHRDSSCNFE